MVVHVPKDGQWTNDSDAWRITRNENHRVLIVEGAALTFHSAHQHKHLILRTASPTDIPLLTVDNVLVTFAADPRADIGGVAAGNSRLGHGESTEDFTVQQWLKPLLLLLDR